MTTKIQKSYTRLPERFYERTYPETVKKPELVLVNKKLAADLDIKTDNIKKTAEVFSGQEVLPGSEPVATAYAGCQFGHFVPQLGDGRAHLLGEVKGFDVQLKGSGKTKFSRGGDGKSTLESVIREFLVSEAMHALEIPTTRSLCIVKPEEDIYRGDKFVPAGILTRLAESHIRVGTFEYFSYRDDKKALELLIDYAVCRHFPEIRSENLEDRCLNFLRAFAERQGALVSKWYGVGFIHGVMNTDNCSIAGLTLDYGPCAFLDEFQWQKVFSYIDKGGRYSYANQMSITKWNILKLAHCLAPFIGDDKQSTSLKINDALYDTLSSFDEKIYKVFLKKLGLHDYSHEGKLIVEEFLKYLEINSLDFTLSFSNLPALYHGETKFYSKTKSFNSFLQKWKATKPDLDLISRYNHKIIPRNHQIQNVIYHANQNQYDPLKKMWEGLQNPFNLEKKHQYLETPPKDHERIYQTFCGT